MATCATVRGKKQDEIIDRWYDSKMITSATQGDSKFFKKMYFSLTGEDFDYGVLPTMRKLTKLNNHINSFEKDLGKNIGGFAKWFYLPQEIVKNNPIASNAFDGFKVAHDYFRGNKEKYDNSIVDIAKGLQNIVKLMAISKNEKTPSIKKAAVKLEKMYKEYYTLNSKGETHEAQAVWDKIEELGTGEEAQIQFKVFEGADALFRNEKLLTTDPKKYGKYEQVLKTWKTVRPHLFKTLNNGLDTYIKSLERLDNRKVYGHMIDSLTKLKDNLKPKKYYFPTDVIEIFPTLAKVQEMVYDKDIDVSKLKDRGDVDNMNILIDNAVDKILRSVDLPGNLKQTEGGMPSARYSKNIIGVLDNYVRNVTRFNYQARSTEALTKAIQGLSKLTGDDSKMAGTSKFLIDYLFDTHSSMMGMHIKNNAWRHAVRGITSWEFISKLGFNFRGALRNATQSIQNFVYFGGKGMYDAFSYLKQFELNEAVNKEMQKHGVFFTDARELANSIGLFPDIEVSTIDGKDIPTFKFHSTTNKFLRGLEKVASISGKPMQVVENKVNRQNTFKIAFGLHHSKLKNNIGFIEGSIREKNKGNRDKFQSDEEYQNFIQKQINDEIVSRSGRFASEMVRELHYEYAPFAKPKVLRTAAGSILGQFQTYSINFFNYNRKIAKKGFGDLSAGEYWGEDAWRMYRMGMVYTTINGVLSPIFNTDISRLVQFDTYDRVRQWYDMIMGDQEAKDRAFFGKGPVIGTLGGPFISDLTTLGGLAGMYELFSAPGERTMAGYLAGYQDFSEASGYDKAFEFTRMLNTSLARAAFVHTPNIWNGQSVGSAFAIEAGLFPSKEMKEKKAAAVEKVQDWGIPLPTPKYAVAKTKKRKKYDDKTKAVMQSLGRLSNIA